MEIFYTIMLNVREIAVAFCIITAIAAVMCLIPMICDSGGEDGERAGQFQKKLFIIFFICLPISLVPSPKRLFETRIGLLKYYAVSPENLRQFSEKGLPHIERIVKKIECKYLGCDDKK